MIVSTNEFILMSQAALKRHAWTRGDSTDKIPIQKIKALHDIEIEFVKECYRFEHIDYFVAILPDEKVILLQPENPNFQSNIQEYEAIAKRYDYKVHLIERSGQGRNPLNCLVLSDNEKSIVFYDSTSEDLARVLRQVGAEAQPVILSGREYCEGLHCATNVRGFDGPRTSYLLGNSFATEDILKIHLKKSREKLLT